MTIVMRPTCWHQNFGPNGLSAPAQGLCLNIFSSITVDLNVSSTIRWAIQDQWSSGLLLTVDCHQQIYRILAIDSRLSPANLPNICFWQSTVTSHSVLFIYLFIYLFQWLFRFLIFQLNKLLCLVTHFWDLRHEESWGPKLSLQRTAKPLVRLGGCSYWSESSLGAKDILLVLSWGGSFYFVSLASTILISVILRRLISWNSPRKREFLCIHARVCCRRVSLFI